MDIKKFEFFENTSIKVIDKDVYVSANQISELYETPIRTIYENISKLKEDGLVVGA